MKGDKKNKKKLSKQEEEQLIRRIHLLAERLPWIAVILVLISTLIIIFQVVIRSK